MYHAGDQVRYVYFLSKGVVNFSIDTPSKYVRSTTTHAWIPVSHHRTPVARLTPCGTPCYAPFATCRSGFVVETVSAPAYFGELEVIDRVESRLHTVTVPDSASAVMAAIPVNVFWRLLLSEVGSVTHVHGLAWLGLAWLG